jgi:hypothetical protein
MTSKLREAIESTLLSASPDLAFVVKEQQESASFGDSLVTLESGELRLRVTRDRGQVLVYFGSTVEPETWFDSQLVAETLGLGSSGGFVDSDIDQSVVALSLFLQTFGRELKQLFGSSEFPRTRARLRDLGMARADRLFGSSA